MAVGGLDLPTHLQPFLLLEVDVCWMLWLFGTGLMSYVLCLLVITMATIALRGTVHPTDGERITDNANLCHW